jgi:ERCC4-type nuclease
MSHKTFSDDRVMAFPRGCRGKTAEAVLGVFKSLTAVGNAEVSDLMHVDGVGEKKAQTIYDHFNTWRGQQPPKVTTVFEDNTKKIEELQRRML